MPSPCWLRVGVSRATALLLREQMRPTWRAGTEHRAPVTLAASDIPACRRRKATAPSTVALGVRHPNGSAGMRNKSSNGNMGTCARGGEEDWPDQEALAWAPRKQHAAATAAARAWGVTRGSDQQMQDRNKERGESRWGRKDQNRAALCSSCNAPRMDVEEWWQCKRKAPPCGSVRAGGTECSGR